MPGRRGLLVALGVGVAILLIAAPSSAQEDGSGEAGEVSPGFLYLTDEEFEYHPDEYCGGETGLQQGVPHFGFSSEVPRAADPGKVPTEAEHHYYTCETIFDYRAGEGFKLGPGTQVTFWWNCERETPFLSGEELDLSDYVVELRLNGDRVEEYRGHYPIGTHRGFCRPDSDPMRLEAPLDPPETTVSPGDNLTVVIGLFGMVSERSNIYIVVQSKDTPSALYGPGFPGLQRDSPTSDLIVDTGNRTGNTGPGNATTYAFTIENIGNDSRQLSLSADGPEAWVAKPSSSALEVPAGETVEANLTVAAPGDLVGGAEARHLVTVASGEETVTFEKTTTVVPGQGEAAPELLGVSSAEESGSAVGELIDEFSVELVATAVVGVGAFVGKQFLF